MIALIDSFKVKPTIDKTDIVKEFRVKYRGTEEDKNMSIKKIMKSFQWNNLRENLLCIIWRQFLSRKRHF